MPWLTAEMASKVLKVGLHPKIPSFVLSHLALTELPCFVDAPVSTVEEKWPLVVFSHGLKGQALGDFLFPNTFQSSRSLHDIRY